jgi:NAD(P)-dependent dehydrogenase (short-subunit alcohol dehydrogenase family)
MKRIVVIGGSSGLGLELAKRAQATGAEVHITGREDPQVDELAFHRLVLDTGDVLKQFNELYSAIGHVDTLVVAAGFFQEGRVDDLSAGAIESMLAVGARAPIYGVRQLLQAQHQLAELLVITSTSQFVARVDEPIYNFVKAGTAHFTRAMAEDERIKKVLLVAPGGMKTKFWQDSGRDTSAMLDPGWVADQIVEAEKGEYRYRFIKIFREPKKVEEVETL